MRRTIASLLAVIPLLGVGCGGSSGVSEDDAIAALKKLGGKNAVVVTGDGRAHKINLFNKGAKDDDIANLKPMTAVKTVDLSGCNLTDAGLEHLKGLTQVDFLSLKRNSDITDAGIAHLKGLTRLQTLDLEGTKITDASLEIIKNMPQLVKLNLNKTGVTDAGLAQLKSLTRLKQLQLNDTAVTDAGLEHVQQLGSLTELFIQDAKVSIAGSDKFRAARPGVQVNYSTRDPLPVDPDAKEEKN